MARDRVSNMYIVFAVVVCQTLRVNLSGTETTIFSSVEILGRVSGTKVKSSLCHCFHAVHSLVSYFYGVM